jgi:hypothetical protein
VRGGRLLLVAGRAAACGGGCGWPGKERHVTSCAGQGCRRCADRRPFSDVCRVWRLPAVCVAAEVLAAWQERGLGVGVKVGAAAPSFVDAVLGYLHDCHGNPFGCVASGSAWKAERRLFGGVGSGCLGGGAVG